MPSFEEELGDVEADAPAPDGPPVDEGPQTVFDRLLSTTPHVDPANAARDIAADAGPLGHLVTGIYKFGGVEALPAIGHVLLAVYLLVDQQSDGGGLSDGASNEHVADGTESV